MQSNTTQSQQLPTCTRPVCVCVRARARARARGYTRFGARACCAWEGVGGWVWVAVCSERQRDAPKAAARCSAVKPSPDTCTHSVEGLGFRA
jgi:hypothetical protein